MSVNELSESQRHWAAIALQGPFSSRFHAHVLSLISKDFSLSHFWHDEKVHKYLPPQDKCFQFLDEQLLKAEREGVRFIFFQDPDFPILLHELGCPPIMLSVQGHYQSTDFNAVVMVGTREPTQETRQLARCMARDLGSHGITTVSSGALGIDRSVHLGSLGSPGRTLWVSPSGLDIDYPAGSASLRQRVSECGAVFSEYPLGFRPRRWSFVRRNQILAALGLGIVVIQAGPSSGALSTARFSNELGRHVMVIPAAPSTPGFEGNLRLLQDGARAVMCAQDVIEEIQHNILFSGRQSLDPSQGSEGIYPTLLPNAEEKSSTFLLDSRERKGIKDDEDIDKKAHTEVIMKKALEGASFESGELLTPIDNDNNLGSFLSKFETCVERDVIRLIVKDNGIHTDHIHHTIGHKHSISVLIRCLTSLELHGHIHRLASGGWGIICDENA